MTPAESCLHEPGPTDCPTLGCFRALQCPGADESWGLGKYTKVRTGDGYFARLIFGLKYAEVGLTDPTALLTELSEQVIRFLNTKYRQPFDGCVVIPSNRSEQAPVMHEVAQILREQSWVRSQESLLKTGHIPVLKSLDRPARAQAVEGKYKLSADSVLSTCQRILVLDDIYDSGATLTEAVATIRATAPTAHIVALTATYLRDPREA